LRLDFGSGLRLHIQRDYIDRVEKGQRGAESAD
jgi:hypothetical protein